MLENPSESVVLNSDCILESPQKLPGWPLSLKIKINLHIKQLSGTNSHHIIEGAFKAVARALRFAVKKDADFINDIPSTKGLL